MHIGLDPLSNYQPDMYQNKKVIMILIPVRNTQTYKRIESSFFSQSQNTN